MSRPNCSFGLVSFGDVDRCAAGTATKTETTMAMTALADRTLLVNIERPRLPHKNIAEILAERRVRRGSGGGRGLRRENGGFAAVQPDRGTPARISRGR